MPDTKIEEPSSPQKSSTPPVQETESGVKSNLTQVPFAENKIATPIAPILNQNKHQNKNELEKQKTAQQNYVADLTSSLSKSEASIKKTTTYLASLQKAYNQAKKTNKDAAYRLANSITQVKAGLATQNKQKSLLKHHAQEAYKTLQELHEHLAKSESGSGSKTAGSVSKLGAASGLLLGSVIVNKLFKPKKEGTKLTPEELDKKFHEKEWENNMRKKLGLQNPASKLTPKEFSKKFGEYLFKDKLNKARSQGQSQKPSPESFKQMFDQGLENISQTPTSQPNQAFMAPPQVKISTTPLAATATSVQAMSMAKKIAQTVKNIVKTVKNIAKVIKIVTTSATIIGAVANVALLLKDKLKKILKVIAKIIAGIQALILLMWLWLLAKIAGIIAGLAFGLISGLPLLLIPGIGPALYAGWVSFWTYKGWTDPLGTLHIATHPWELITRPVQWIGDQFSGWGGAAKGGVDAAAGGVGSVTSGVVSTIGNFVTGLASTGWGAATSVVGGATSTVGSVASSIWGGLTGTSSAVAGNIASVAVAGGIGTTVTATVLGAFSINSSMYTQALDPTEQFFAPGQNQLFTITKTADKTKINNPDILGSENVTFTIRVTAAELNLANLQITDVVTTTNGTSPYINDATNTCKQTSLPATLAAAANWSCTMVVRIDFSQSDAVVTNTVTLTATSEDGTKTETSSAVATVRVGSVAQGCPSGWPTPAGSITQLPQGTTSHYRLYPAEQAIDIGGAAARGTPTFATFSGTVESRHAADDNGYGWYVDIRGNCQGQSFLGRWAHLQTISTSVPPVGSPISAGTQIGTIDATGNVVCSPEPCDASHLHYSFFGLTMGEPYIPAGFSW